MILVVVLLLGSQSRLSPLEELVCKYHLKIKFFLVALTIILFVALSFSLQR